MYNPQTGPTALADNAAKWAVAGVDIGIVILPTPHGPEPLAAIAEALAPLNER